MEKMTPREALEHVKNVFNLIAKPAYIRLSQNESVVRQSIENDEQAYKTLEALVLATEQAPTLEKLGYVRDKAKEEVIKEAVRIYKGNGYTIEFIEDGEISIGKWDCDYDCSPMTVPELLACAEVIKEMEKEKV